MKKIDYYAQHNPWKVPKWVGVTLGGIFGAVAVTSLVLIVYLTRSAHADPQPQLAAAAATAVPAVAAPAQVVTPAPVQPAAAQPAVSGLAAKHLKHSKSSRAHAKAVRNLAASKRNRSAILARHDSRDKRRQKDDLDRMLGL